MELYEANKILYSVKAAISADGYKLPSSAETDGLLMLLGKLDIEKHLAPKVKHARAQDKSSAAYNRSCKLIYFFRALKAVEMGLSDPVTTISFTMLHKSITGDLSDDAGKLRSVDMSTDGNAHTDPKYIGGSLKSIIAKMNEITGAPMTAKDDFAGYLSHYMRELIILHPFERGSEFTVRVFILLFSKIKGFSLGYHRATPPVIRAAEQKAFATDNVAPLFSMFTECLSYDHKSQQQEQPSPAPRTRREVAKDLCRPSRATEQSAQQQQQQPKPAAANKRPKKQREEPSDDVIRRAVRLQQKISKLNEQLTELIKPLDGKDDN